MKLRQETGCTVYHFLCPWDGAPTTERYSISHYLRYPQYGLGKVSYSINGDFMMRLPDSQGL